jgi:pimeloyl-ACP methyl ester carboxylesterase
MLKGSFALVCLTKSFVLGLAFLASCTREEIALRDMGSFHIGGREVEITGKPVRELAFAPGGAPTTLDPNGTYLVESMYVQYFLPADRRGAVPLLLWHGGGLTGVTYETKPDGGEGWLTWFLKKGWDVYNSDAVERGRAGWAMYPDVFTTEPVFLPVGNPWERFRIGPGTGSYAARKANPGTQFPVEHYESFVRQNVPRWTSSDAPTIAAYTALVDRACPCVVLVHSQAGQFGYKVAQARPELIKALVAVEPAAVGHGDQVAKLAGIPILVLYGDFIEQDSRWPTIRSNGIAFADAVKKAGGSVEVVDLPKIGIKGNSHMIMMDKNSSEVAAYIQAWLERQGLFR